MEKLYSGKTKDVYATQDPNVVRLVFKDDVTGKDGVFDPGENQVGLTIEGAGLLNLAVTRKIFTFLSEAGIYTHFVGADENSMTVRKATPFGNGLEVVVRYRATGSFIRRFGQYAKEGQRLHGIVEITLKDDDRNDPPATKEILEILGLLTTGEYEGIVSFAKKICDVLRFVMLDNGIDLYDVKLEFGRDKDGELMLIDEVSAGCMRAYKNGEHIQDPMELSKLILEMDV
ncbi:MAG: phosphoribosylaminoimidazolesuccinocarboxamide synthase [Defluviitaleaceae bacterium]|nr:phosphoribosylaminoimidazolesuccinocarboxamide synthase [Defluviitaleaceae bacterium]